MLLVILVGILITYATGSMNVKWILFYNDNNFAKYIAFFISVLGFIFFNVGYGFKVNG